MGSAAPGGEAHEVRKALGVLGDFVLGGIASSAAALWAVRASVPPLGRFLREQAQKGAGDLDSFGLILVYGGIFVAESLVLLAVFKGTQRFLRSLPPAARLLLEGAAVTSLGFLWVSVAELFAR